MRRVSLDGSISRNETRVNYAHRRITRLDSSHDFITREIGGRSRGKPTSQRFRLEQRTHKFRN